MDDIFGSDNVEASAAPSTYKYERVPDPSQIPVTTYRDGSGLVVPVDRLPIKSTGIHEYNLDTYSLYRNLAFAGAGNGGYDNNISTYFKYLDRFGRRVLGPNQECVGLTFITRPCLNLTSTALRQVPRLTPLNTTQSNNMAFGIRCYLDSQWCWDNLGLSCKSDLIDVRSPWLTPLCNSLNGFSGSPEEVLETYTSPGGFQCESQVYVVGFDNLSRTYDLNLQFVDPDYGPVLSIFKYWTTWMAAVARGDIVAYPKRFIDRRKICYTVGIYRFVLDRSKRIIRHWAKYTGCFPRSNGLGGIFNFSESDDTVPSSGVLSIPFKCSHVALDQPVTLAAFNRLSRRYCRRLPDCPDLSVEARNNYTGLPYIKFGPQGPVLVFKDHRFVDLVKDNPSVNPDESLYQSATDTDLPQVSPDWMNMFMRTKEYALTPTQSTQVSATDFSNNA